MPHRDDEWRCERCGAIRGITELQPTLLDDHEEFLRMKGLEEEFKLWLERQPLRS